MITTPKRTERLAIQNQLPLEYIEQTPSRRHSAKYIERGINSSLYLFIYLGRFVKEKESSNAENTIQNQLRVLFIAKLQIKQVNNATP